MAGLAETLVPGCQRQARDSRQKRMFGRRPVAGLLQVGDGTECLCEL